MSNQQQNPTSRLALVTGAASGIGRATTLRFIHESVSVLALDRSAEALDELVAAVPNDAGAKITPCIFDLSDTGSLDGYMQELLQKHKRLHILVNNAAVWFSQPLTEVTDDLWDLALRINMTAPMCLMRAAARHMKAANETDGQGGAIVNIASRNAFVSSIENTAYDATKAALVAMTRTAAGELAQYGIRVNAVCPGVIATPPNRGLVDNEEFNRNYRRLIPMDRFGEPEEMASVVYFLAGPDASFVTGQTIIADGGQIACQNWQRLFDMS